MTADTAPAWVIVCGADTRPKYIVHQSGERMPCHTPAEVFALVEAARREEREAIARDVDCGCDVKPIVLAKLASHGEREAWRCCGQHYDACLAIQAAAIRARSTEEQA